VFFKAGSQWLATAPRYRGTLLCGLSVIGAIIAIGYNGSKGLFGRSAPTQASDVVAARISAMSSGSGASKEANSLPKDRVRDAEFVEFSPVEVSQSGNRGLNRAIVSDKSFLVADTEKQTAEIRDKEEAKKPTKKSAQESQRRASSDKDRKFNPSREIKRTGENITMVLRDIF
jgi:hypothetical protein